MDDMSDVMRNYRGERQLLERAVLKAARAGEPADKVADYYRSIFPRELVHAKVEAIQLAQHVRTILNDAGIFADVGTTGGLWLESARVSLGVATDDNENEISSSLAQRARTVLAEHGLALHRGEDAPTDGAIDDLLVREEPVYVREATPTLT